VERCLGVAFSLMRFIYVIFCGSSEIVRLRSRVTGPRQFSCCISISNIVISILITGIEEALNVVKMKRLAVALSIVIAGNAVTQRSIYYDLYSPLWRAN